MKRNEAQAKLLQKARLFESVFSSPDGQKVLAALEQEFGYSTLKKDPNGRIDPHASIAAAGSREVLVYIHNLRKHTHAPAE